jgi:PRTRC genetic system protein A
MPFVDYLVGAGRVPARSGLAYHYILAGDGVFVASTNSLLEVRIPVARAVIRGFQPAYAMCTLVHGRIPAHVWDALLCWVRLARIAGCEVLAAVAHDAERGYHVVVPGQRVGPTTIKYERHEGWLLEVHSHVDGRAYFSSTDSADEQRLRLYGVIGKLDQLRPQVALRAGAYGYFLPLPWTSVFEGDHSEIDDVHNSVRKGPSATRNL